MKRLISLVSLLLMAVTSFAHDFEVGGIYYKVTSSSSTPPTVSVTYRGSSYSSYSNEYTGNVVIPELVSYNGKTYNVTSIGEFAFAGCSGLTSITIPNSVTSIGRYAFEYCSGLTSITIPNSVTSIDYEAFYNCKGLTNITIPESVTTIGGSAFSGTAWYENQPDGVVYAGKFMYKYKGTMPVNSSIEIKEGTVSIGNGAFSGCSGLTNITIPNSVTSIGDDAFLSCSGLTSVTIPNSVTSIGGSAFYGCSGLTSVIIPESVISIGYEAFEGCSGLARIVVEEGNAEYDSRDNCNAIIEKSTNTLIVGCKNTIIPNSVTSIGYYAFKGCSNLTSINIGEGVTSIGFRAFYDCTGLTSITIPNSVTTIDYEAFYNCKGLTNIIIPESVTTIEVYTFYGCSGLTNIRIPSSVTSISESAFRDCSGLTSITIPSSVTSIGGSAFYGCSGLTSVIIPESVISIGYKAFDGCSNLKFVYSLSEYPAFVQIATSAFPSSGGSNISTLYVKKGLKELYSQANGWKNFVDIREMTDEQYNALVKETNGDGKQEEKPEEVTINSSVTLSSAGYATFYNTNYSFKLPAGLSALVITSDNGQTLTYKTIASGDAGGIVPKGMPVILVSNNRTGGTYTLSSTSESASYTGNNLLYGSSTQTMTSNVNGGSTSGNSNYVYYKLAYGKSGSANANKLGWYWGATNGASFSIAGGKAWLALPKSSAMSINSEIFLDEETAVNGVSQSETQKTDALYNTSGQRVNSSYNGLIISNGKKIIK